MTTAVDGLLFGVEIPARIWRTSRKKRPALQAPPVDLQGTGRFDGRREGLPEDRPGFGVLYCSETPLASFIEVLAPFRESLATLNDVNESTMMDVVEREHSSSLLETARSVVSGRWQQERVLTSASLTVASPLFDLANPAAVQFVRERLALALLALQVSDLDFSHILGNNRELTQAISRWVWSMKVEEDEPLFSGIRYRSRFDPECICFALYEDRYSIEGDIDIQPITLETPGFAEAAATLRLSIA